MASITRRSGRTPNCRSSRSIGAVMTAHTAAELDAFCIVRVLFCQRYLSRPEPPPRLDLQDATRLRLLSLPEARDVPPGSRRKRCGALTVKAEPQKLTRNLLLAWVGIRRLEYPDREGRLGSFATVCYVYATAAGRRVRAWAERGRRSQCERVP